MFARACNRVASYSAEGAWEGSLIPMARPFQFGEERGEKKWPGYEANERLAILCSNKVGYLPLV